MRSVCLLAKLAVLLIVAMHKVPPQEQNDCDQNTVAAQVNRQGLDVARCVTVKEDLRPCGVSGAPCKEVHCDADRFLGLSADVACQHRHAETLCSPEGEDNPVRNQETSAGGVIGVFDGHDYDRADEGSAMRQS